MGAICSRGHHINVSLFCLIVGLFCLFSPHSGCAHDKGRKNTATTSARAGGHGAAARQLFPVFIRRPADVMSDKRQRARVQGSWARQVPRSGGRGGQAGRFSRTSPQPFTPSHQLCVLTITSCFQGAWPPIIISRPRAAWPPSLLCGSPDIRGQQRPLSSSRLRR